jgi:thioredoxin 1
MVVHNLAKYVAHHRNAHTSLSPYPTTSTATTNTPLPQPTQKRGVADIRSKTDFQSNVLGADQSTLVVLDCFATWCGPCKVIAPKVSKFSDDFPQVKFFKVDVDEVSDVAQELGIRAMPTFLLFKGGEKVGEVVGANEKALEAAIKKIL